MTEVALMMVSEEQKSNMAMAIGVKDGKFLILKQMGDMFYYKFPVKETTLLQKGENGFEFRKAVLQSYRRGRVMLQNDKRCIAYHPSESDVEMISRIETISQKWL